jgi:uncharacterized membrane protein YkvA (DUF1232 family)
MKELDELLEDNVAGYEGRHDELIALVPALFRLMMRLLEDPRLPGKLRPMVVSAIAYFALSTDIMPEDLQGPLGYADDLFYAAIVADHVHRETGLDEILTSNWEGKVGVLSLVQNILAQEKALIGDKRDLVLWYIGYEHLKK